MAITQEVADFPDAGRAAAPARAFEAGGYVGDMHREVSDRLTSADAGAVLVPTVGLAERLVRGFSRAMGPALLLGCYAGIAFLLVRAFS